MSTFAHPQLRLRTLQGAEEARALRASIASRRTTPVTGVDFRPFSALVGGMGPVELWKPWRRGALRWSSGGASNAARSRLRSTRSTPSGSRGRRCSSSATRASARRGSSRISPPAPKACSRSPVAVSKRRPMPSRTRPGPSCSGGCADRVPTCSRPTPDRANWLGCFPTWVSRRRNPKATARYCCSRQWWVRCTVRLRPAASRSSSKTCTGSTPRAATFSSTSRATSGVCHCC